MVQENDADPNANADEKSGLGRAIIISVILICVALASFSLAVAIADNYEVTKHVFRDVGIALIVAAVIIMTIEWKARDELNRMVSKFLRRTHENLFQTILGVEFPKPMFDFVRDRLMKEPIFRTKTEVHYTLRRPIPNGPQRWGITTLTLDVMFSYTIKNLSDREQKHPIKFFVEGPLDGEEHVASPRLIVDGVEIPEAALRQADTSWEDRPGLRRFEHDLKMSAHEEHVVEGHHSMQKLIADSENWRCLHPCDGLRLSITHPTDLSVGVDAMHPDDLVTIQDNEVSFVGAISRPLFPANGFLFWWHPRTTKSKKKTVVVEPAVNSDATKSEDRG